MSTDGPARPVCLVVPCFDEGARFSEEGFALLASDVRVALVLVDDGSRDDTGARLRAFASAFCNVSVIGIDENVGKGEAVRLGMLRGVDSDSTWVGYVDADLATPVHEIRRLIDVAVGRPDVDVVLGSRVAMLGRQVRRSALRHYSGRVFATLASLVLSKPVYDTQCGAKLFRSGPALERAISTPFRSRWAFDVELLGRLDREGVAARSFWEEPLETWSDAPASKRSLSASVRATLELWAIRRDLDRRDEH